MKKNSETRQKIIMFFATGFYSGQIPFAPGTFGSLTGMLLVYLLILLTGYVSFLLTVILILLSVFIANSAEKQTGLKDPGCIVIDEICGIFVTFLFISFSWFSFCLGFLFFRLFDILKPFPVNFCDKKLQGGLGIVVDDVVAGIMANIVLQIFYLAGF